jgi:hypothetical protein
MFVQDYLIGERSLDELQAELIGVLWGDRQAQPQETLELAQLLDLHIAEFTGAYIDEEDLRRRLRESAGISVSQILGSPAKMEFGSTAPVRRQSVAFG